MKNFNGKSGFNRNQQRPAPAPYIPQVLEEMRLNKFVAHCGICSRRKAAVYIKEGAVMINNVVEINPSVVVKENDVVALHGKVIKPEQRLVYILMNKPKDTITSLNDEKGRMTVIDLLNNRIKERVFPVGRLDRQTTGLLVLTNDGDLAKKLSHPSHKVKKIYHATLDKPVEKEHMETLRKGVELEDGLALVDSCEYVQGKGKDEVGLTIHLGKNRIVRRLFEHLGYKVIKLDRVYFAGLTKKDLPRGRYRPLSEREIIMLRHFI